MGICLDSINYDQTNIIPIARVGGWEAALRVRDVAAGRIPPHRLATTPACPSPPEQRLARAAEPGQPRTLALQATVTPEVGGCWHHGRRALLAGLLTESAPHSSPARG